MKSIRIGSGAGYAGDRLEPAVELVEHGELDYIVFECLAERTIAIAQQQKMVNPEKGYDSLLEYRMKSVLPVAVKNSVKIISNMGAANPLRAVQVIKDMAQELGITGLKIAAVIGDDITENINKYMDNQVLETGKSLKELDGEIISANVYMGVDGIVEALKNDADIIITGRVADPALFIAPLMYEFGWSSDDYDKIGKGILVGHLMECGAQVTGGYFADPGIKDVDGLATLGFPYVDVNEDGSFTISKLADAGGMVTIATCTEQVLYEIHNPARYITPDGVADFTNIRMEQIEKDVVKVTGGTGIAKTDTLKVSIGYKDCYIGEGEMSYAGISSLERAKLAAEIVTKRLKLCNVAIEELRVDLIGVNSTFMNKISESISNYEYKPNEVRLRISGRTKLKEDAIKIGNEVETLYTNGPTGGGGATKSAKEIISVASIFVPRKDIKATVTYEEV